MSHSSAQSQLSTLQQLRAGQLTSEYRIGQGLTPLTRLQISADLTAFPSEIFALADDLEILDLSNNQLSDLPDDLHRLTQLKILFLSNNQFERIPKVLSRCAQLEMISFKSNRLRTVDDDVLPQDTRWLILTDNQITSLPDSMGQLHRLQKLALAGNCLTALPESMSQCHRLELARLSANNLTTMPDFLFALPRLSWLAFSGNTKSESGNRGKSILSVALQGIELGTLLGEGASGRIYQGRWPQCPASLASFHSQVAVKIFKGDVTSDGYPQDELDCCLAAGEHPNLIKVLAQLDQTDENKTLGLVMELIPNHFYNLGLPPSLKTCTRDTFNLEALSQECELNAAAVAKIALQMAQALAHLHAQNISHGDVYAHNTMINNQADMLLGDFGAATDLQKLPEAQQRAMECIEVRAFGCLLDDLLPLLTPNDSDAVLSAGLSQLAEACLSDAVMSRPRFNDIVSYLQAL